MLELSALRGRLDRREVSCVELAEEAVHRLDTDGRRLGAVVNLLEDRALAAARRADRELAAGPSRGPLHGIPYGVKDLLCAAEGPTTWGSPVYRDRVIDRDAAAVEALDRAGAVLVAKLATDELAGALGAEISTASISGPCRNPHDPGAFAGSSSGGPAAAVGAGLLPFALGTETIGSILEPAAFCGTSGLRPTAGRVDMRGVMPVATSLDRLGPLAARPSDCAAVLGALDPEGRSSRPIRTIGVPRDAIAGVDDEVAEAFRRAVGRLENLGVAVRPVDAIDLPVAAAALLILVQEFTDAHRELLLSPLLDDLAVAENKRNAAAWLAVPEHAHVVAREVGERATAAVDVLLQSVDALVYPAHPTPAPPIDVRFDEWLGERRTHWLRAAGPLAGLPAVTVSVGRATAGLPVGVSLVGPRHADDALLRVADAVHADVWDQVSSRR